MRGVQADDHRGTLGTLVARVGLVPDAVLVHSLVTLHRMTGGRFIAALGTGDSLNREENEAYGVPFAPVADRVADRFGTKGSPISLSLMVVGLVGILCFFLAERSYGDDALLPMLQALAATGTPSTATLTALARGGSDIA